MNRQTVVALACAFALVLIVALAGCSPRESAGPAAPSASVSRDLAVALAGGVARQIDGEVASVANTGSMLPLFDSRASLVLEKLTPSEPIHVGDIVVFSVAGSQVCHRVIDVKPSGIVATRGTGNSSTDAGWHRPTHRVVAIFYTLRK